MQSDLIAIIVKTIFQSNTARSTCIQQPATSLFHPATYRTSPATHLSVIPLALQHITCTIPPVPHHSHHTTPRLLAIHLTNNIISNSCHVSNFAKWLQISDLFASDTTSYIWLLESDSLAALV